MKRSLMVFAAVTAFAVPAMAPLTALAQDRDTSDLARGPDRRGARFDTEATVEQDGAEQQQRPARPERPDRPQQPDRPERPGRPDRPDQPDQPWRPDQPQRPDRPDRPDGPGRPDQPNRPDRPHDGGSGRGAWTGAGNGGWDRGDRRWDSRQDRLDHREFRQRFNRDQWQRNWNRSHRSDWWRDDRRFRGWSGVRIGFYFAPGYGYYNVPRTYYGRTWYEGDYLPSIFWRYRLDDYRTYGLGYPPQGTQWVYVDNAIYLIDEYDGYIIEVIRNAWSW